METKETHNIQPKYAHLVPEVWDSLAKLPRTGWVMWGIENPETTQEHVVGLMNLAADLAKELDVIDEKDFEDLLAMVEIHDWPEAEVGDEVILAENPEDKTDLKQDKFEREKIVMEKICASLGDVGKNLLDLWVRFEQQSDKVAAIARELDQYHAIEKAYHYELEQGKKGVTEEFITYSIKYISHPVLLEKIATLKKNLAA